ncbi:hypothetical protein BY996DRAFT_6550766 [Phakopsora pachyrhizi]|nr:hypothetical protein BY996DRAFT_6550766 [Phakopsora pachyrhizi]
MAGRIGHSGSPNLNSFVSRAGLDHSKALTFHGKIQLEPGLNSVRLPIIQINLSIDNRGGGATLIEQLGTLLKHSLPEPPTATVTKLVGDCIRKVWLESDEICRWDKPNDLFLHDYSIKPTIWKDNIFVPALACTVNTAGFRTQDEDAEGNGLEHQQAPFTRRLGCNELAGGDSLEAVQQREDARYQSWGHARDLQQYWTGKGQKQAKQRESNRHMEGSARKLQKPTILAVVLTFVVEDLVKEGQKVLHVSCKEENLGGGSHQGQSD